MPSPQCESRIQLPPFQSQTLRLSEIFTASLHEIDKLISNHQEIFTSLPHSSHRRSTLLVKLAHLQSERFQSSHDERDLDASILQYTHAIFLPSHHLTEHRQDATVPAIFIRLSRLLVLRSLKSKQPSDVRSSAEFLRYLRDRSLQDESFDITPLTQNEVTTLLVRVLALRAELERGNLNAIHGIEEMSVLCRGLLSSDALVQDLDAAFDGFAETIIDHVTDAFDPLSQHVVECLCEANTRLPGSHVISMALSLSFVLRFLATKSNDDYECAMGHLDKSIASHSPEGSPRAWLVLFLDLAANLAFSRCTYYRSPEHLVEAISRTRALLGFVSAEDPKRDEIIHRLASLVRKRAIEFGDTDIPEGQRDDLVVGDLPSFSQLASSLVGSNTVTPPSMTGKACLQHFRAFLSAYRITDKAEIDKAVQYCRLLLPSLQRSPNQLSDMLLLKSAGRLFHHAFEVTNEPEYLNESIDIFQSILEVRRAQWTHTDAIFGLMLCLSTRHRLSNNTNDLDQMIQLFPVISNCTYAKAHERFAAIAFLAWHSRAFQHPFAPTLYNGAISLMNDTLVFAPTLEIQHYRLIQLGTLYERLPLDYASYQIRQGHLKEAIETLEQARGLIWSQMRGFRTSIDLLWAVNSHLAEEFASVNQELEALTTSSSSNVLMDSVDFVVDEENGSFDRVLAEQRKLLDERNALIVQIRALPGFENFLMASPFDTLQSAAACGPVIIINHSEWHSDILILLHNSLPSLIPTDRNFYFHAKGLKEQLLAAQKKGLDSMEYEDTLISVLETLYELVGRPVIQRLRELNVPEQSRIWWCPTSVFCSLPLHAMGPIQSDGPHKLYFSDLYIPSYTPTLSALIDSRKPLKPGAESSEKPSILLVAQPDEFMPRAWDEISLIRRLNTSVTTLVSKKATPSAVVERLQDHRFAHFSCHGTLEMGRPFDACFKLYQGQRLTLLEILRSRLPSAEFAFLSACHTAELTEKSVSGEGLHLTAAVQFAGFRSVVGTMWAMADIDGHDLAKHFYASVFSERWKGVPYYERTAEALRDAVKELRRKKKMSTERWVNFVHFGA